MSDTDPLLRAVVDGNPAAPDGEALVRLGHLVRAYSRPTTPSAPHHLEQGVRDRLTTEGDAPDADADRLLALIRTAAIPERPVDLTAAVRRRLQLDRFLPQTSAPRRRGLRVLAAVLAGHVAAALVLGMVRVDLDSPRGEAPVAFAATGITGTQHGTDILPRHEAPVAFAATSDDAAPSAASRAIPSLLPPRLPSAWTTAREAGADLLLPRRLPELREDLRSRAGMADTAPLVRAGLAWLERHAPDAAPDSRALAALALLGEGDDDGMRSAAARTLVTGLKADSSESAAPAACLALTEAAILWHDEDLRHQAERLLARLDPARLTPDEDGGFALLALELAQQHGFQVPGATLMSARRTLARTLPADEAPTGRIGLAAFARFIFGLRHNPSTHHLVDLLAIQPPDSGSPPEIRQWFMSALALAAEGGPTAQAWNRRLVAVSRQVMPHACVNATSVADAADDVAATARVLLALQAPYRYLPVAE